MDVRVGYDLARPSHHLSLSDGETTIGLNLCNKSGNMDANALKRNPVNRTALKTSQGSLAYSDLEEPWVSVAQTSWANGRGEDDLDTDKGSFFDNFRTIVLGDEVILGALERMHSGLRKGDIHQNKGTGLSWVGLFGESAYTAVKFTADEDYDAVNVYLEIKRKGTPQGSLYAGLFNDDGGVPGTEINSASFDTTDIDDILAIKLRATITSSSLTATTDYWVKVWAADGDGENCWLVGMDNDYSGSTTYRSESEVTWVSLANQMYYYVAEDVTQYSPIFFKYRRADYVVLSSPSGAPTIYINGDRGFADANTGVLSTLIDGTKTWETNQFAGAIAIIISGDGINEPQRWRVIDSNTDTTLTLSEDWTIEHDTTTEYVILGADTWEEVAGHGITEPVSDVLVHNNIMYFAVGEDAAIRRGRYNSAGYAWADDGTNRANYLCAVFNGTDDYSIWRARNEYSVVGVPLIDKADSQSWAVNLVFGDDIVFKDSYGKITNLLEYGTENTLWVMREGIVFYLSDGIPIKIPLEEMATMMDDNNGSATLIHNVFLFFTLGSGIERYYESSLDDVGMNRNEGMPVNRQGIVSSMLGRPGEYYASIDGGSSNYSSIMACDGSEAWYEVFRGYVEGERILDTHFQAVPGSAPDRMMVYVGGDILTLNFPSATVDPTKDSRYAYTHEGAIESGYVYANLFDVYKIYNSLKLFTENLTEDEQTVEFDYKINEETTWTTLDENVFYESPSQELLFGDIFSVSAKRLRYRLRLMTEDSYISPTVKAAVIEAIARVDVKYNYTTNYRAVDGDIDLEAVENPLRRDAADVIHVIDGWAEGLTPLIMRSTKEPYDNKRVYIDPQPLQPTAHERIKYVNSLVLLEV